MAQTNFTPISLYYSTTAAAVPTAGNLVAGELAINTQDGKLFYKDAAGVVQTIASKDTNSGTFTNLTVSGVATFGAGTVSLPSITTTGDTNTGIFFPAADTIAFTEGGVESMRIDSSGNVGIGTSSPAQKLHIAGTGDTRLQVESTSSGAGVVYINASTAALAAYNTIQSRNGSTVQWAIGGSGTENALPFYTNGTTERMRIDSSGNVGIGTSSPAVPLEVVGQIRSSTSTQVSMYIFGAAGVKPIFRINEFGVRDWDISAGNFSSGTFSIQSAGANGVYLNGAAATSWSSASDERVKTDLKPIEDAATKVSTLRAVTGRYKTDEVGVSRSFLIAQDVQAVLPEAVGLSVMSDGSEVLGLAYTEVIPLLVAAIKELKAEIDLLKGK
jgi:hypothetical protein